MASSAHEVLILFSQALSQPADSESQANILNSVKTAIEQDPAYIPTLYPTILSVTARAGNGSLLKRWIADVVELVAARMATVSNALSTDQRIQRELHQILQLYSCLPSRLFFPYPKPALPTAFASTVLTRYIGLQSQSSRSTRSSSCSRTQTSTFKN